MRWVLFLLLIASVGISQVSIKGNLCDGDFEASLESADGSLFSNYFTTAQDATLTDNRLLFSIASAGTYTVEYKLTNEYGCVYYGVSTILVEDCPYWSFYVPNTFTPNEDSYNNTWYPKYENVYIKSVEIFNRWGELIYNELKPWDGDKAQDDVYAYRIMYIANNVEYESIGRLNVVR